MNPVGNGGIGSPCRTWMPRPGRTSGTSPRWTSWKGSGPVLPAETQAERPPAIGAGRSDSVSRTPLFIVEPAHADKGHRRRASAGARDRHGERAHKSARPVIAEHVGLSPSDIVTGIPRVQRGQRQRIGIARRFGRSPGPGVLDEPTSAFGRLRPGADTEHAERPADGVRLTYCSSPMT